VTPARDAAIPEDKQPMHKTPNFFSKKLEVQFLTL
jgi:hypothetical protein